MGSEQQPSAELSGKLAVVIGSSSGIGLAVAEGFVRAGARVVLGGRSLERLAEARAQLPSESDVDTIEIDVASPESSAAAAEAIGQRHGATAILFNSAGFSITKPALEVTVDEWDAVHNVQLRGTFFSCQAFARSMATAGYGKIINVSSTWAATVSPGRSVYCAAKAGVSHLTLALGTEWAPLGIRVNAIGPTATATPTIEARLAADPGREDYLRSRIPMGRLATAHDMVGASVFLASPASDFITGQTLFVDGGWVGSK
jgi:NAD(P)-dependent dehydrogenase (short-subunit alcohol dehydrogenase family)